MKSYSLEIINHDKNNTPMKKQQRKNNKEALSEHFWALCSASSLLSALSQCCFLKLKTAYGSFVQYKVSSLYLKYL
jgi:hypothetical protein